MDKAVLTGSLYQRMGRVGRKAKIDEIEEESEVVLSD
jgi:hypothetical protein